MRNGNELFELLSGRVIALGLTEKETKKHFVCFLNILELIEKNKGDFKEKITSDCVVILQNESINLESFQKVLQVLRREYYASS